MSPSVLVLSASPSFRGSTATLADHVADRVRTLLAGAGHSASCVRRMDLGSRRVNGCTHCNVCEGPDSLCPLTQSDEADRILTGMIASDLVFWLSPVYFYTLPSQAKALVDRSQKFYARKEVREKLAEEGRRADRRAVAFFVAGREKGQKLFDGSLLPVRHFFAVLGHDLVHAYGARGVETPSDLTPSLMRQAELLAACALHEKGWIPEPSPITGTPHYDDLLNGAGS